MWDLREFAWSLIGALVALQQDFPGASHPYTCLGSAGHCSLNGRGPGRPHPALVLLAGAGNALLKWLIIHLLGPFHLVSLLRDKDVQCVLLSFLMSSPLPVS